MKKVIVLLAVFFLGLQLWAQAPVIVTKNTKTINGKKYYAHVVEKGQTVFSIARAYGVNYREAVLKSDIDKIAIGDTVFLPTNEKPEPTKFHYYVVKQGNTL
ncbi:MAG: LysM peptidoglycan-binding domain-containing protein, partial [Bacteroidales bacterium]|nr:LysM peptidoglycan-binding domain-containing protein [Bacteroidales bacterium]